MELGRLVLDLRVVELGACDHLYDGQGMGVFVADNRHRDLGALDALLHEHALARGAGEVDGALKLGLLGHTRDAEAAAVAGGLHKEGQPELVYQRVLLFLGELRRGREVDAARNAQAGLLEEDLSGLFLGRHGGGVDS